MSSVVEDICELLDSYNGRDKVRNAEASLDICDKPHSVNNLINYNIAKCSQ